MPAEIGRRNSSSFGQVTRDGARIDRRVRIGEVERHALAHPQRFLRERRVDEHVRHLVADRPFDLAALPQDGERQQLDLGAFGRRRHPPRLPGRAAECLDCRMNRHGDRRRGRHTGRRRNLVAGAADQIDHSSALAFLDAGQRNPHVGSAVGDGWPRRLGRCRRVGGQSSAAGRADRSAKRESRNAGCRRPIDLPSHADRRRSRKGRRHGRCRGRGNETRPRSGARRTPCS